MPNINIKLGLDNTDFVKALRATDREIRATTTQTKALQKGLDFEWNEAKFAKTQELARQALAKTEEKVKTIKDELKKFEELNLTDGASYKKLQNELVKVENQATLAKKKLEEINNLKLEHITKKVKDLGDGISNAGKALAPFSAIAAGALAGATKLAKDSVAVGDKISTLSQKFDMSAESIQKWQYVAMQTDTSADRLLDGAAKVREAFGNQMAGDVNNATKTLDELRLGFNQFKNSEQAFEGTLLALSRIEDSTMQAYYAKQLFGDGLATELLPILKQGEQAIATYSKEFEAVGYLSDENVKKLSELSNVLNNANAQFQQAKTELGIALIPILTILADMLTSYIVPAIKSVAEWFDNLSPRMQDVVIKTLAIIAVGAPLALMIGKVIGLLPTLIALVNGAATAAQRATAGFLLLGSAVALAFDIFSNWDKMSWVEVLLKGLATAALVAAAAIAVFHASWSVGLAVGGIVAGIAGALAAVKGISDSLGIDIGDVNTNTDKSVGVESDYSMYATSSIPDYNYSSLGGSNSGYYSDSSVTQGDTHIVINIYDAAQKQTSEIIDELNAYFTQKKMSNR